MGLILIVLTTYFGSAYNQATPFARALLTDANLVIEETASRGLFKDPVLCVALEKLCVEEGGMDVRQIKYSGFQEPESCHGNLIYARGLYQRMKDAPPLTDAALFPAKPLLIDAITYNRIVRKWMVNQRSTFGEGSDQAREYDAAIRETDRLYQFYDLARDAQCEFYYVNVRRSALMRLRELLGFDMYYRGGLPPCVPHWLFTELK